VSIVKRIFTYRWFQCCLLILGIIVVASIWARWRPAQRFAYRKIHEDEFRLVTWNVGYFAPTSNKNALIDGSSLPMTQLIFKMSHEQTPKVTPKRRMPRCCGLNITHKYHSIKAMDHPSAKSINRFHPRQSTRVPGGPSFFLAK
jgi:hypothetical protein